MSTKRCYYETLEVERSADDTVLKSSFRKLAMKFHPDRNPGDDTSEVKFKEINEAYEVLKDKDKRAAYDRFGHAAFEQGGPGGGAGFGAGFASSFSDIFEDLFGMAGQRGRGGRERGADLRYNMEITLEEAFGGKTAQIEIPVSVTCEACSGIGAKAGTKPKTCSTCGGAGRVRQSQGFFTLERTCPGCQGRGQMIEDACPSCSGQGRVTRERTLSVNIPPGGRGRHPDQARRRGRGRGSRRPARRPLHLPVAGPAPALPARRRRFALPGADLDGDGRPRRRIRGADHRQRQNQGEGAGRNPVGPPIPHCIKRHAGAALAPDGRHVRPGCRRDPAESHQEAAGIAGGIRKALLR
ncbi:curved DNA-binding protein CbpA [Bradyrhizobium japonicum]